MWSMFLKPWYFLLYVAMTQKDFVIFTEGSTCLLQRHQGMPLVCLLAASATNNRIALSKPCMWCEREMLLEKLASYPPELRARRNIFSTCRKIRYYVFIIRVCSGNNKVCRGTPGDPGGPARFPLLGH